MKKNTYWSIYGYTYFKKKYLWKNKSNSLNYVMTNSGKNSKK